MIAVLLRGHRIRGTHMEGVNWISIVIGGVFTAALTLSGQIIITRYQQNLAQSLAQQLTLWNTRNARADKITTLAGQVSEAVKSRNPKHYFEQAKAHLQELLSLVGDVADYPSLAKALRGYQGYTTALAYNLNDNYGHFDSEAQRDEALAKLDNEYNTLLAALQQYRKGRDGAQPSIRRRLRKAVHLPAPKQE